jgi:dipeptidase
LGSLDIIDYAIQRGWYDPQNSTNFNFRIAYGNPDRLYTNWNIVRKWISINYFSEKQYDFNSDFPFSFKPKSKVSLHDLMCIVKNHYEGSEFEMHPDYNNGNPHENNMLRICSEYNQYSIIAQLRNWMPNDIGNVLWFAPRRPCIQPFIPIYFGTIDISSGYEKESYDKAALSHFKNDQDLKKIFPNHASWVFYEFAKIIDNQYGLAINGIKNNKDRVESTLLHNQIEFEQSVLKVYDKNSEKARRMLTNYSSKYAVQILNDTKRKLIEYKNNTE